jgi:hypothetical protein
MPLTAKGEKIKSALTKEYGEKTGKKVLYAGKNKGTFTGIDSIDCTGRDALERAIKAGSQEMEAQKQARALMDGKRLSGRDRRRAR